jgi:segregation and condensation protein A
MNDYKVQLENFYGPFDLLLYLVREEELNIYDIPIARITDQYLSYLEMMKKLDIDVAGEFMVVAATLMEIKSRTLLPGEEEEGPEEADPRFELIRKLIEYKKYKDRAKLLNTLIENHSRTFPRPPLEIETQPSDEPLVELDLWALAKSFARLIKETALETSTTLIYDDVPLEVFIQSIMELLRRKPVISFSELVRDHQNPPASQSKAADRLNILKNFLATLELAHQKKVNVQQEKDFGEIIISLILNPKGE